MAIFPVMAVYHFTIHPYRSWRPDNPRRYVHHTDGLLPTDEQMARWYDAHAKFDPMKFQHDVQLILTRETHAICQRRGCRLHAVGNEESHLHAVTSWLDFIDCSKVVMQLKGSLSRCLGLEFGAEGRKWFSRSASEKRVLNREHLDYLVTAYLPTHSGVFWKVRLPLP
jgi:hypothetical protein